MPSNSLASADAGGTVWFEPPDQWPTAHCHVLYCISRYAQQAANVQTPETWIRQVALLVLLYEGIEAGVLPFDYAPTLVWVSHERHVERRWLRISQEAKSIIDDLWEARLVNGIKLSSVDYQPVTAYQVSTRGLEIVQQIPQSIKDATDRFIFAPPAATPRILAPTKTAPRSSQASISIARQSIDAGKQPIQASPLLRVRYDGRNFLLMAREGACEDAFVKVSSVSEGEDVSYVSSPFIPSCLRSSTSYRVDPTSNILRATESARGSNMMAKAARQSLVLSQVHALVGEWMPFGANQISALNERLGAMERCQGGLFSSEIDKRPTETHFQVPPGLTQVKILDFDQIRFINFEAEINFPEDSGVIQVENFGMHLHVSGSLLYGVKIEAIQNHTERAIPMDLLSRLLVDIHQDSSKVIQDLMSRYQLSVLDMLFMDKASQRNKYNLILARGISPKLPACKYLDKSERENELKQVLGEVYACYDLSRDDVLFLGRDGCLVSGPSAEKHEALLTTFMGLNSREIFIRNFFVRTFVLDDTLASLRKKLAAVDNPHHPRKLHAPELAEIKQTLSDAARHMILLIECLQYLLESVEDLELPPIPLDMAGARIFKALTLLERKNNVIVRCQDSIKFVERLRTQLDVLVAKFEVLSKLQLAGVAQELNGNVKLMVKGMATRYRSRVDLEVIRAIFAGHLAFDIVDRLSAGSATNLPSPKWVIEWIKKPLIDSVPGLFFVLNLFWFYILWTGFQWWHDRQVASQEALIVIRAHADKKINITNLQALLRRREVLAADLEYDQQNAERQVYSWLERGFPSADSTTHIRLVVDEQQHVLRDIRLQIFCALDEAAPIKTSSTTSSRRWSFSSMSSSRRLHPMPTATAPLMAENTVLEQFSALLRTEGVYLDRRAPLVRLGSHVNLLAAASTSSNNVSGMMGSSQRRRSAVVVERALQ